MLLLICSTLCKKLIAKLLKNFSAGTRLIITVSLLVTNLCGFKWNEFENVI